MPANFLANRIFSPSFPSRRIMTRWACGEPAPCMDSTRAVPPGHGLDEPSDLDAIFNRDVGHPTKYFLTRCPTSSLFKSYSLGIVAIKPPARSGQSRHFEMEAGHVLLADVGQHGVHQIGPGGRGAALGRAGDGGAVEGFAEVDHLRYLVFDVRALGRSLDLGQVDTAPVSTSIRPVLQAP